ncbi:uncharacterized protein MONBRDRAFT_30765 [Monosiga brevicollis MX1]|uniref:acid phosphatase n=1 Tax=Monosiga brevicollis TaxID=81824 RepID=A9UP23_MONBE|nr:uncharacterized protein MONBRDRAFT_30765 [Monosiga brevicollis MX1]EDQ92344.1 predicted protein [Monosiga brevicollis MX1]|eukprot:XP_001742106.1 hypothetical protein [Monosiga brevicollis MX1]
MQRVSSLFAIAAALVSVSAAAQDSDVVYFNSDSVSAVLLGDWGGQDAAPYAEVGQLATVPGLTAVVTQVNAQLALLLGDNFYSSGIHSDEHDARFVETFEQVYNSSVLEAIPYYVIAGNHDHKGNVSAQIAYSQLSSRWHFDDYYYKKSFVFSPSSERNMTIDIIFIDTVLLAGNSDDLEDKFGTLPGPIDADWAETQWSWIQASLRDSTADYLFTAGHYPVWSGCSHGPTDILVDRLKPMLEQYGATGHLSGHDHCLEYIDEGLGPVYPLSGAGDNCCYDNTNADKVPEGAMKFAIWNDGTGSPIEGGFAIMTANATEVVFEYFAANATRLFTSNPVKPRTH